MISVFLTGVLAAFVNFFLILGTNRLTGVPSSVCRAAASALLAGAYSGLCVIESFAILGRLFFRIAVLFAMCLIAYGCSALQLRKGGVFALLHLALSGLSRASGGGMWTPLFASAAIYFLCNCSAPVQGQRFVPVKLTYKDVTLKILALKDTGNCLRDPVTGKSVLVIGAKIAQKLTGLTAAQLKDPVASMGAISGLRLIPYKTIGREHGMMLAMRFQDVKIGHWQGSALVAFAPEGLENTVYQGITGGMQ